MTGAEENGPEKILLFKRLEKLMAIDFEEVEDAIEELERKFCYRSGDQARTNNSNGNKRKDAPEPEPEGERSASWDALNTKAVWDSFELPHRSGYIDDVTFWFYLEASRFIDFGEFTIRGDRPHFFSDEAKRSFWKGRVHQIRDVSEHFTRTDRKTKISRCFLMRGETDAGYVRNWLPKRI